MRRLEGRDLPTKALRAGPHLGGDPDRKGQAPVERQDQLGLARSGRPRTACSRPPRASRPPPASCRARDCGTLLRLPWPPRGRERPRSGRRSARTSGFSGSSTGAILSHRPGRRRDASRPAPEGKMRTVPHLRIGRAMAFGLAAVFVLAGGLAAAAPGFDRPSARERLEPGQYGRRRVDARSGGPARPGRGGAGPFARRRRHLPGAPHVAHPAGRPLDGRGAFRPCPPNTPASPCVPVSTSGRGRRSCSSSANPSPSPRPGTRPHEELFVVNEEWRTREALEGAPVRTPTSSCQSPGPEPELDPFDADEADDAGTDDALVAEDAAARGNLDAARPPRLALRAELPAHLPARSLRSPAAVDAFPFSPIRRFGTSSRKEGSSMLFLHSQRRDRAGARVLRPRQPALRGLRLRPGRAGSLADAAADARPGQRVRRSCRPPAAPRPSSRSPARPR